MALSYAAKQGIASPGVSGIIAVYPVDENGKAVENSEQKMSCWRADVPVLSSIP